jgi:ketosteroid isomerase-like protein
VLVRLYVRVMTSIERPEIARTSLPVTAYVPRRTEHLGVVPIGAWSVKLVGLSATRELPGRDAVDAAIGVAGRCLPEHPRVPQQAPVAFVIAHRGADALWVIVGWWDLDILHHRLFRANLGTTALSAVGPSGPTACVWELLAIDHERGAWVTHVLSRPDEPDYGAYLASALRIPGPAADARAVPPDPAGTMTIERLGAFADAWAERDVERLMTFMAEDCVYTASVGPEPGRTYRGREEVRRGFAELLAYDTGGVSRSGRAFIQGTSGAAEWSYEFAEPDGSVRRVLGCDLYEFRGDKIALKNAFRKVAP